MNRKNIFKLILDIVMAVLFVTFFDKNFISFKFHILSGLVFGALILMHMLLNKKWIVNISKRLFDKSLKTKTRISYILSGALFVVVFSIIISGIFMMKAATYDRVMFWKMLHIGASYLSIALIGVHVGLYWKFVSNMFKKIFEIKNTSRVSVMLARVTVIAVLIFGMYNIHSQNYFAKVSNTLTYAVQHIVPQDLEAPTDGGHYEKESLSFVDLTMLYGSIASVFSIATYYGDVATKKYGKSDKSKMKLAS